MMKEFDYKEFANVLRFQVRGLVPEQFKDKEQALQSLIFEEAKYFGQKFSKFDLIDSLRCSTIIQVIGEWSFHKYIDCCIGGVPEALKSSIVHNVNEDIFNSLIKISELQGSESQDIPIKGSILANIETLVKKSYKTQLENLRNEDKISDTCYKKTIKSNNFKDLEKNQDKFFDDVHSVPVSIWDIIKAEPFVSLAYIVTLPITFFAFIVATYNREIPFAIFILIIFCILLWRFLTRTVGILFKTAK